jgi:fatty-acyl-CoA synthase
MLSTTQTLYEAFQAAARVKPGLAVLSCGGTRTTNRELLAGVEAAAGALAALGVKPADRVAVLLPPGADFVLLFFAVARIGAVFVPINPDILDGALADILADAEPTLVVAARPVAASPSVMVTGGSLVGALRAGTSAPAVLPPRPSPGDLFALMYTSGTTGKPKATMHTHASLIAPVLASLKVRELWLKPSSLRAVADMAVALTRYRARLLRVVGKPQAIMSTMGWHSITGLHVMLQGLLMGDRLVAMPRFHPAQALRLVAEERVTVLVAVPTAYMAMLAQPGFERYDTSSLIVCAAGGSACPPPLAHRIQAGFGCALYNGFGMTEAAGGISVSGLADSVDEQAETVGRPMPGIDVKIVDGERRALPPGAVGELAVRGEGVMVGYYKAPELTAMVKDGEGWLYTGDMARIDEKGFLRIVGRSKDMIVRGGQNIYPTEVENFMARHPLVEEVAVTGVPAPVGGESVWAFVRLKAGAAATATDLLGFCRGKLETYKIPSQVRFLSELPRSELGKVQKYVLREMAMRELEGGAS